MRMRVRPYLMAGLAAAGVAVGSTNASAQNPPEGVEVLARGPIHEAFATTTEQPAVAPVVAKRPPDAVEELPPDQKPEGENVQFIPGYWSYDEDRSDFVWISGFWRAAPPGRMWVPGSWRQNAAGWQWTAGMWQDATPQAPPQIEYLPPPPQPLEIAPATPAPTSTSFYVPGSWVYRNRYVWRPGFWIEQRPNWVWTPACYRWTPAGYIYVEGYWDYPLAGRGMLFAPVYFTPGILRPAYVYTPVYVVREPCLYGSLFIRSGYGSYYFGDYFEPRYATVGFTAWAGGGSAFAVNIGIGAPRRHYDPLWDYYRYSNRNDPVWAANVNAVYAGRYNGTIARPPATLVQQNTVVNNVVNNTTIVNNNTRVVNNNSMALTSIQNIQKTDKTVVLKPVSKVQQVAEQTHAKELQAVSVQRNRLETTMVERGQAVTKATDPVRAVKLDVPKAVVARAQVSPDGKNAPPLPVTKLPPATPTAVKVDAKPVTPATPVKVDPKIAPPVVPKGDPKAAPPKIEIKPTPPKVDPPKPDPTKPKGVEPVTPIKPDPKPPTVAPTPKPSPPGVLPVPKPAPPAPAGVLPVPKPTPPVPAAGPPKPAPPAPPPANDKDKKKDDPKKG